VNTAAVTDVAVVNRLHGREELTKDRRARGSGFKGELLDKRGRTSVEKTRRESRDFPTAGSPSRGRTSLLDIVLPGFYPAVYPCFKDCLSRTSHPPKQAGTLDAHLIYCCANAVPGEACFARLHGFPGKSQRLRVVLTHPRALGFDRRAVLPPHERAVIYFGALSLRSQVQSAAYCDWALRSILYCACTATSRPRTAK
jgi:hypothetical protein